jgi:hypothetical protein
MPVASAGAITHERSRILKKQPRRHGKACLSILEPLPPFPTNERQANHHNRRNDDTDRTHAIDRIQNEKIYFNHIARQLWTT